MSITDIDIVKNMVSTGTEGLFPTPDYFLLPLRITGTGITERSFVGADGEKYTYKINRPEDVFLTEKFLQLCNGLPVCFLHPSKDDVRQTLNYDNFHQYIIGTVFYPYIKGDEVWGFAKIFNIDLLKVFEQGINSTSPHVFSSQTKGEDGIYQETLDGINHVAIVPAGHWDTDKPAVVDSINNNLEVKEMDGTDKPRVEGVAPNEEGKQEGKIDTTTPAPDNGGATEQTLQKDVELDSQVVDVNSALIERLASLEETITKLIGGKPAMETKVDGCNSVAKIDEGVDKRENIRKAMAIMGEQGLSPEDIREVAKLMETDAYNKSDTVVAPAPAPAPSAPVAPDAPEKEEFIDEAEESKKEEMIKEIFALADASHSDIKILRPAIRPGDTAARYISRFLLANKDYVPTKYRGILSKIDEATFDLAKDALNEMKGVVLQKTAVLNTKSPVGRTHAPTQPGTIVRLIK